MSIPLIHIKTNTQKDLSYAGIGLIATLTVRGCDGPKQKINTVKEVFIYASIHLIAN